MSKANRLNRVVLRMREASGIDKANCETCAYYFPGASCGEYGGPPYDLPECGKKGREHVANLRSFPFKREQNCWYPCFWLSRHAERIDGSDESVDTAQAAFDADMEDAGNKRIIG